MPKFKLPPRKVTNQYKKLKRIVSLLSTELDTILFFHLLGCSKFKV